MTEPIFASVEAALTFAFNFTGQQSPVTPMTKLGTTGRIGTGKGLVGVDGAGQSGFILSELDRLPKLQRCVLTVRFGNVRRPCGCCGQPAPTHEWQDAVDALSWCAELEGYPRTVKHAMIERIICRRKCDLKELWANNLLVIRTARRHFSILKKRFNDAEREGLNTLDDLFRNTGLVGEK